MSQTVPVASVSDGAVVGAGDYAVGDNGDYFAVGRRCRHLRADLAEGSLDENGCLVCPWHGAKYDVRSGRMIGGPQGVFAKVPGLGATFKAFTRAYPLKRGSVHVHGDDLVID